MSTRKVDRALYRYLTGRPSVWLVVYRYLAGRPLTTRPGVYPYFHRGDGRWAGWQRQLLRLALPVAVVVAYRVATTYPAVAVLAAVLGLVWARRRWADRRFRRTYITPTVKAVRVPLGTIDVDLHVDRRLGQLVARLARPLSPAEQWLRGWYGRCVEPGWRWPADQATRLWWALGRRIQPRAQAVAGWFRRPGRSGPRIELRMSTPYVAADQRKMISSIIGAKIPVGDLTEIWHQVGHEVTAVWVPRARPPALVGGDALAEAFGGLAEWEFFLGLGAGDKPVVVSLREDSPHIAISAGSGAGKSVLAQLIAVQVLRRGGRVVLLDRKGSHRWALGLDGVDYCTRPAEMHQALLSAAGMADERNALALREPEGWDPGPRLLVVCEELNATVGQLAGYWASVRGKGEPKRSPAIGALNDIAYMGRSGKVNLVGIAQMLSARAIGGPEARENFAIRCLGRYTANAWRMLVPEAAMPRPSRVLGRWQVVVAGQATETQVCYLTAAESRKFADVPDGDLTRDVPRDWDTAGLITLREAIDEGLLTGNYDAVRKRLQRDRHAPTPRARRGAADLYLKTDLTEWGAR